MRSKWENACEGLSAVLAPHVLSYTAATFMLWSWGEGRSERAGWFLGEPVWPAKDPAAVDAVSDMNEDNRKP